MYRFDERLDFLEEKKNGDCLILKWASTVSLPTPQHLSIFIGSWKVLGSVTTPTPCECVPRTWEVPSTRSRHHGVISASATDSSFVDFKPALGSLWFLRPRVFILPAFVWPCPALCPSAEQNAPFTEEPPPFLLFTTPSSSVADQCVHSLTKVQAWPPCCDSLSFCSHFQQHVKLDLNSVARIACFKFAMLPICGQQIHKMVTLWGDTGVFLK